MGSIEFFAEGIEFSVVQEASVKGWLRAVVNGHGFGIEEIAYVFLSDEDLLALNLAHLQHDTLTDIITFVLHPKGGKDLLMDIFISVDRVRENANEFGVGFNDELHRVMVHGLLHAIGYDDKAEDAKLEMRKAEDLALSLREF
ncbi:MAG: rRNA maturation RNase YbeY [Bacteroidota bacterium]